jgi:hypothetical protein
VAFLRSAEFNLSVSRHRFVKVIINNTHENIIASN